RPAMPTLELIAVRTGKPVEFFLADASGPHGEAAIQADLRRVEELALAEDLAGAVDLGSQLLGRLRHPDRRAAASLIVGSALVNLDRHDEAVGLLEDARRHYLAAGDPWSA